MAETDTPHATWDKLLKTYVVEGEDGVTRFDYGKLQGDREDRRRLQAYLDDFASVDLSRLTFAEKFAAYSNIYNALTVSHIVDRYPIASIRSGYWLGGPWKSVQININGKRLSLHDIEHDILRPMGDARVHYVINCASYSCPNLRRDALTADTLEADLEAAARDYINHPRGVSIRSRGGLEVSEIYKWFEADFGGDEAAIIAHFLVYAEADLAALIRANPEIKKYNYDWSLNDVVSSQTLP
ncbi:MAG: DUF547 domain-containing protein [Henriciella sp.]|jgi:hypothetical protein